MGRLVDIYTCENAVLILLNRSRHIARPINTCSTSENVFSTNACDKCFEHLSGDVAGTKYSSEDWSEVVVVVMVVVWCVAAQGTLAHATSRLARCRRRHSTESAEQKSGEERSRTEEAVVTKSVVSKMVVIVELVVVVVDAAAAAIVVARVTGLLRRGKVAHGQA